MTNVQEFFDKLNQEMAYIDPHKWLLNLEVEDIPEVIEELEEDIFNLEESINEYDGEPCEFKHFVNRVSESITYKRECIEILQSTLRNSEEVYAMEKLYLKEEE